VFDVITNQVPVSIEVATEWPWRRPAAPRPASSSDGVRHPAFSTPSTPWTYLHPAACSCRRRRNSW